MTIRKNKIGPEAFNWLIAIHKYRTKKIGGIVYEVENIYNMPRLLHTANILHFAYINFSTFKSCQVEINISKNVNLTLLIVAKFNSISDPNNRIIIYICMLFPNFT